MTENEQTAYAVADWMIHTRGNSFDRRLLADATREILLQHGEHPTYRYKAAARLKTCLKAKQGLDTLIEFVEGEDAPANVRFDLAEARKRILHEIEHMTLACLFPLTGDPL